MINTINIQSNENLLQGNQGGGFLKRRLPDCRKLKVLMILLLGIMSMVFGQAESTQNLLKEVRTFRQANEHAIIKEFIDLLSIPNVSHDQVNIRKNAAFIKKMMEKRGIQAQILETPGNPVIYGERRAKDAKGAKTLLFYIHYDGQPVDPSQWIDSEPFKPVLRPGKMEAGATTPTPIPFPAKEKSFQEEWRIYARSTSDDKAPIISILTALDALKQAEMPLKHHIKFILDGEEEVGSPNIRFFLEKYKHLLKSDVLFMCDGPLYFSGAPTLFFGVRGITSVSITIYGPNVNLHSGHYGNWAPNPALRLAQLLSTMKDETGKVAIKGFYDTVVPLSPLEKDAIKTIPSYDNDLMELYGFCQQESSDWDLSESILYPSLNVNGLNSGWVGKHARTIVPATATASIDIRLTKGNDPEDMVQKIIQHIKNQGYHVLSVEPDRKTRMKYPLIAKVIQEEKGYRAARTSMELSISKRLINALSVFSDKKPVLIPSLGGSLPIYIFEDILKIPFIGLPVVNYDNNQHQPNENLRIGQLWQAIEIFAAVMQL